MQRHWIGYSSIVEWAARLEPEREVYAELVNEPGAPDKYGLRLDRLVGTCAQIGDRGHVHYFRTVLGSLQMVGNHEFDPNAGEIRERARSGWEPIVEWLASKFEVRRGVVAHPKDAKLYEAGPPAEILAYDRERDRFVPA